MTHSNESELVIYATDIQGKETTMTVDRAALLDFAIEKLLPLYNMQWRDRSSPMLDRDAFASCLALPDSSIEIALDPFGFAQVRLLTGELFVDHDAYVLIDQTGKPSMVSIE